jgi:hypothetical protein
MLFYFVGGCRCKFSFKLSWGPSIKVDIHVNKLTPDATIKMQVDSFTFYGIDAERKKISCCDQPLMVSNKQLVLFKVYSSDLTYGFGILCLNNSMA